MACQHVSRLAPTHQGALLRRVVRRTNTSVRLRWRARCRTRSQPVPVARRPHVRRAVAACPREVVGGGARISRRPEIRSTARTPGVVSGAEDSNRPWSELTEQAGESLTGKLEAEQHRESLASAASISKPLHLSTAAAPRPSLIGFDRSVPHPRAGDVTRRRACSENPAKV